MVDKGGKWVRNLEEKRKYHWISFWCFKSMTNRHWRSSLMIQFQTRITFTSFILIFFCWFFFSFSRFTPHDFRVPVYICSMSIAHCSYLFVHFCGRTREKVLFVFSLLLVRSPPLIKYQITQNTHHKLLVNRPTFLAESSVLVLISAYDCFICFPCQSLE